jgi:hypothetical protein
MIFFATTPKAMFIKYIFITILVICILFFIRQTTNDMMEKFIYLSQYDKNNYKAYYDNNESFFRLAKNTFYFLYAFIFLFQIISFFRFLFLKSNNYKKILFIKILFIMISFSLSAICLFGTFILFGITK